MSHLDLMRTMQRSLMRADVTPEYSSGFNPHAVMSIALPLSVGMSSVCELMDFGVFTAEDLTALSARINSALPEGIEISEIYESAVKLREIKYLRFSGVLFYENPAEDLSDKLRALLSLEELIIDKKSKRGISKTDIGPFIIKNQLDIRASEEGIRLSAVISVPDVSPAHFLEAIRQLEPELYPDCAEFNREELLQADFQLFK